MKLKLSSLKNPRKRIEAGDWVPYPHWTGRSGNAVVRFQVSGLSSDAYQSAAAQLGKDLALKYKDEPVPPDESHRRWGELLAEHILHSWDGLDEDYSPERASELLTDRDFEALNGAVIWCARKIETVNVEFVEATAKNSEAPSATS